MRVHIDRITMDKLRGLRETGRPLWKRIEQLKTEPVSDDAREVMERRKQNIQRYEVFEAGYWVGYEVDTTDSAETVINILYIEAI